jgi:uncharacterized FlaG/YvyC family protein
MSNLSVINFAVGGTLTISGKTTLAETILSSSTASFQGVSTTSLTATGASIFNNSLPTSTQTPTQDSQLTTKIYVDTADTTLNTRITDTDSAQRTYIDTQDTALGKRITDNDTSVRTYIDASYNELNTRVTGNDTDVRFYIDASYNELNTRVTDTDSTQKTYIDNQILAIGTKPIFYVFQNSSTTQSVPNNAMTKVRYFENVYNVFGRYSNNEYLFRPASYPGYYHLNATVCLPNITSGYIAIFKDAVEYSRGTSFSSTSTSPDTTLSISTVMYLKGGALDYNECDIRVNQKPFSQDTSSKNNICPYRYIRCRRVSG